ncbi:hypothetical protein DV096_04000 [Bradymonadaceae bacterium TMQ3]|uniref:DUF3828 domain-containing protein n=1 Tax=Lujinxingia sediminis TaxID=2480984 RepID=A0ABY0CWF3_9DELT|nr:hypothetical protein [Lujinxingia sediminis]RDV39737.1 hypothetical protein DV096_04000 [Bradymonadaceae bacterium TMQ3]RVU48218.1 hypothetical protein EA187_01920 [Lujinxingia sediminis]TXC77519.1 hypothetical protein FRC91_01935 [Bradymonadales bacterium TMQ1]
MNRLASKLLVTLLALTLSLGAMACSSELDPTDPGDAYTIFRDALFAGTPDVVWERLDPQTRAYFQERHERLVQMNQLIESYLPQTDHRLARSQSGAELLESVNDGRELFEHVFKKAEMPDDDAIVFGSGISEIRVSEEGTAALVVTRGEQEFVMVQAEDETWHVDLVGSGDFLDTSFGWLTRNEEALARTVEDLIAEERHKREAIIADLMNLKLD